MTTLSEADEERIQAIIDEVLTVSDDPYVTSMMRELDRTVDEAGVSPGEWELSPQTSEEDWDPVD